MMVLRPSAHGAVEPRLIGRKSQRLDLRPVLVALDQQARFPEKSLGQMRQGLIRNGEDPNFTGVWKNA